MDIELRTGKKVGLASVDQGYRGHETDELLGVTVLMPKDKKRKNKLSRSLRKKLKRRNAIEPTIGHLKHDHRMDRCYLKGEQGDKINALGAAMGLNLRKLLAERADARLRALGYTPAEQDLTLLHRQPGGNNKRQTLGTVRFVPLVGEGGWGETG